MKLVAHFRTLGARPSPFGAAGRVVVPARAGDNSLFGGGRQRGVTLGLALWLWWRGSEAAPQADLAFVPSGRAAGLTCPTQGERGLRLRRRPDPGLRPRSGAACSEARAWSQRVAGLPRGFVWRRGHTANFLPVSQPVPTPNPRAGRVPPSPTPSTGARQQVSGRRQRLWAVARGRPSPAGPSEESPNAQGAEKELAVFLKFWGSVRPGRGPNEAHGLAGRQRPTSWSRRERAAFAPPPLAPQPPGLVPLPQPGRGPRHGA